MATAMADENALVLKHLKSSDCCRRCKVSQEPQTPMGSLNPTWSEAFDCNPVALPTDKVSCIAGSTQEGAQEGRVCN